MINKIKNWILGMDFVQDSFDDYFESRRLELYQIAFRDAREDVVETRIDDIDEKAQELSNSKLSNLLSVVDMNKIVTLDKNHGIVFIGGIKADDARLANLKAEAEFFLESDLWHLIYETPKELAQRTMFVNGENLADMAKGRSMLYTLGAQKNIIETFKGYIPKQKPQGSGIPTP